MYRWVVLATLGAAFVGFVGCTTSSAGADGDALVRQHEPLVNDAGEDADADADADASDDVFPSDTLKVVVKATGGMPRGQDDTLCRGYDDTYTLLLPSHELSWRSCDWLDAGGQGFNTGERALSDAEYAALATALQALRTIPDGGCWEDVAETRVTFTTATGETSYLGEGSWCNDAGPPAVTGLDSVFAELAKLRR